MFFSELSMTTAAQELASTVSLSLKLSLRVPRASIKSSVLRQLRPSVLGKSGGCLGVGYFPFLHTAWDARGRIAAASPAYICTFKGGLQKRWRVTFFIGS